MPCPTIRLRTARRTPAAGSSSTATRRGGPLVKSVSGGWPSCSPAAPPPPLLALGRVVTAYEQAMSDANPWRTDRYAPCPRPDASRYLTFLASVGYQLASIEQALADDVPWAGD